MIKLFFQTMGVQRSFLAFIAFGLIVLSFFNGGEYAMHGWRTLPTLIAPSLVPILFFVLCLDMMMSLIYSVDSEDTVKKRYRNIVRVHLVLVILLVSFWVPFFVRLVTL